MKYAIAALCLLSACGSPSRKIPIEITNSTSMPLTITAGDGFFSSTIILAPGQTWSGALDPRIPITKLPVRIR